MPAVIGADAYKEMKMRTSNRITTLLAVLVLSVLATGVAGLAEEQIRIDFCDPSNRPDGHSIASWLAAEEFDGAECFDIEVVPECGSLDVRVTRHPGELQGWVYEAIWTDDGTVVYPANSFPAEFDEDEGGGLVDVTYYLVGPEKDYLVGTSLPNFWDGTFETFGVDTDCEDEVIDDGDDDVLGDDSEADDDGEADDDTEVLEEVLEDDTEVKGETLAETGQSVAWLLLTGLLTAGAGAVLTRRRLES